MRDDLTRKENGGQNELNEGQGRTDEQNATDNRTDGRIIGKRMTDERRISRQDVEWKNRQLVE